MAHLFVAALVASVVLYLYDLYVSGPAAARIFVAHLPALGMFLLWKQDDWAELLSSYACVPITLFVVGVLQYLMVLRDATMAGALRRR